MITIDALNKYYHKGKKNQIHVIDNTNLTLSDNGMVALLGNSGSGKTTLLNVIGGLDKAKKGNIYINGQKITSKWNYKVDKIRNISIGYVFQDYKLINDMSVFDNVAIVLKMLGIKDKSEIKERVEFILDKVGMLRYKKRPASMLSGGERQRVAIARAIVKDPDVILADEPTGNLDSKNSIEIMNIIKAISKNKLVILVTHEQDLAYFYADRIINISDGKIESDIENTNANNLNYQIDNRFYLKDFKSINKLDNSTIYSDKLEKLNLDIVFKNGNIYIKNNGKEKVEIVDDDSNIEFVNEHYKGMNKKDIDSYDFTYSINAKKKYSSIYNIFKSIKKGFNKILDYTTIKKVLLLGFVIAGCFIMYALSSLFASIAVNDKDFIEYNRNYLYVTSKKLKIDSILDYEKDDLVNYLLPGNSLVSFKLSYNNFYQTSRTYDNISGSLSNIDMISDKDLIYGVMPTNEYEIVVDKLAIQRFFDTSENATMCGYKDINDIINQYVSISNMKKFKIVGITDLMSPSIYAMDNQFVNILANSKAEEGTTLTYLDYSLIVNDIELRKGRYPTNDYEVMLNVSQKDNYKLNKQINETINGHKLTVVGYYYSTTSMQTYLVNNNMIKYDLISNSKDFVIYSKDKTKTLEEFRDKKLNINDSYEVARTTYISSQRENTMSSIIVGAVIILISLIEMFLMMRSSFLSRIKEIGIYRAIGVKKIDIYNMFIGEILVITTLTSVPGILFTTYLLSIVKKIKYLGDMFVLNVGVVLLAIILVYVFNLLIGLIPVANVLRKKPAAILARHDLD